MKDRPNEPDQQINWTISANKTISKVEKLKESIKLLANPRWGFLPSSNDNVRKFEKKNAIFIKTIGRIRKVKKLKTIPLPLETVQ